MKKVFLSVPMKNRTKENIEKSLEKMRVIARIALENEEIEFINTVVEEKPPYTTANEAVWYLGKSIELLSQADVLVCVDAPYWLRAHGCENEKRIFQDYMGTNQKDSRYIELPISLIMCAEEWDELYNKYMEEERRLGCESQIPKDC